MSSFSARLKLLRKQDNLTQDALSKAIGISKSTISMYENGNREPDFETLESLADFFNVDLDYLMGKTDIANNSAASSIMAAIIEENRSGRAAALDNVFEKFGTNRNTYVSRLVGGKYVLLYYHVFDELRNLQAASSLLSHTEYLSPAEAEHLQLIAEAYTNADDRARQMVDLALDPFLSDATKREYGSIAPEADEIDAEDLRLAREINRDKKSGGRTSASNGAAGKKADKAAEDDQSWIVPEDYDPIDPIADFEQLVAETESEQREKEQTRKAKKDKAV